MSLWRSDVSFGAQCTIQTCHFLRQYFHPLLATRLRVQITVFNPWHVFLKYFGLKIYSVKPVTNYDYEDKVTIKNGRTNFHWGRGAKTKAKIALNGPMKIIITSASIPPPPPPHSVLFRVRICLFPPFERTDNISEPPFRGLFAGFSCLGDPPKSKTLLNVPPIFYFITPFLNFSGVQRERERKTTPFLKEISGWKVKYPPFFTILGPDFVARKVPLYRRFWEHACGPSDPGVGGGGGPGRQYCTHNGGFFSSCFCCCVVVFLGGRTSVSSPNSAGLIY